MGAQQKKQQNKQRLPQGSYSAAEASSAGAEGATNFQDDAADDHDDTKSILKARNTGPMKSTRSDAEKRSKDFKKKIDALEQHRDEAENDMTDDEGGQQKKKAYLDRVREQIKPNEADTTAANDSVSAGPSASSNGKAREEGFGYEKPSVTFAGLANNGDSSNPIDADRSDDPGIGSSKPSKVKKETSETSAKPSAASARRFARGNDASDPIDLEDELDLLRPSDSRPTAGLPSPDQYRTLECVKNALGNSKVGIFKYGPQNRPIYRREAPDGEDLSQVIDISNKNERIGEMFEWDKVTHKKIWFVNRRNFVSVQGVAFPDDRDVEDLNPDVVPDSRPCPVDVLIKWTRDGHIAKSWETRTTFRRVWGKQRDGPDMAIYDAVKRAESRFEDWKNGKYETLNRSPTPDPAFMAARHRSRSKSKALDSDKSDDSESDGTNSSDDSEDSDSEDENARRKIKSKGRTKNKSKKSIRKSTKSKNYTDSDDSNESSDDERSKRQKKRSKGGSNHKAIDPVEFERSWCLINGKNRKKLSSKDKRRMQKDLRNLLS